MRRLRHRLQLRRQEHPAHELPPRRAWPTARPSSPRSTSAGSSAADRRSDRTELDVGPSCPAAGRRAGPLRGTAAGHHGRHRGVAAGTLGTAGILDALPAARSGRSPTGSGIGSPATATCSASPSAPGTDVDGSAPATAAPIPKHPAGPCITSVIDEQGGPAARRGRHHRGRRGARRHRRALCRLSSAARPLPDWLRGRLHGGGPLGALLSADQRRPLGHDRGIYRPFWSWATTTTTGPLVLDGDQVRVSGPTPGPSDVLPAGQPVARRTPPRSAVAPYLHDPLWSKILDHNLVTVHPLGGCVMADAGRTGVVDDRGRVFAGADRHRRPRRADGVGRLDRPAAARGQPAAHHLRPGRAGRRPAGRRARLDHRRAPRPPSPPTRRRARHSSDRPGLRFTERMVGFWAQRSSADAGDLARSYERGRRPGEPAGTDARLRAHAVHRRPPGRASPTWLADGGDSARSSRRLSRRPADGRRRPVPAPRSRRPGRHRRFATCGIGCRWQPATDAGFTLPASRWSARATSSDVWAGHHHAVRHPAPRRAGRARSSAAACSASSPRTSPNSCTTMTVTGPVGWRERLELEARFGRAFAGALCTTTTAPSSTRARRFNRQAPPRRRRRRPPDPARRSYPTARTTASPCA